MKENRRDFIKRAALAGGAAALATGGPLVASASFPSSPSQGSTGQGAARHPLNILILGGTSFLGPHLIAYAQERGHEITIFTRGRTEPTIHRQRFKHVERLVGDRDGDLTALEGRAWDAVIDNSGHDAAWTRDSAALLKDSCDLYLYTSSTGVYYPYLGEDIDEETEVALQTGPDVPDNEDSRYGIMKSRSEREARSAFGLARTIVVRPTYIIGPGDRSNRFPYWPVRLARGGEVLVPGRPDDPIQFIDVRDLTEWMIRLIEMRNVGTFNVVGPASRLGMHEFVHGAHAATSSAVEWVPVPDYDFLIEHGVPYVVPWIMPVDDNFGSARASNAKAIENGLTYRPLAVSCLDVLDWWRSDAVAAERRERLTGDPDALMMREPAIIEAWRNR